MDRPELCRLLGTLGYALTTLSNILMIRDLDKDEKAGLPELTENLTELIKTLKGE